MRERNRARRLVASLTLPNPWDVNALVAIVSRQTGRRIHVASRPAGGDTITGTVFRLAKVDVIFIRSDLTGLHRDHVLVHELGHVLAGHLDELGPYRGGLSDDLERAATLMLHRQCAYGEALEREAEEIADLSLARVRQQIAATAGDTTELAVRGFGAAMR